MFKFVAGLGVFGFLFAIAMFCAAVYCWGTGVAFGFHHGIIVGILSIIPPVGFVEGFLHLLGVI